MKKYTYLVNFDSQTLERVGESFAVKGDGGIAELEFAIPSNFGVPANQALWRVFFRLPGEKESLFETLPAVTATESGDYVTSWTISKAITQKAGRLAFSLAAISGNDIQWNSRTVIMQVPESQYQPESEEAEKPYTGRLDALEGSMAAIRGEFAEVQDALAELKETATLGTPIPESLVANMTEGHVYIYTGTEPGYTAGHVYYYVGGALTDGGVYGGTAVDATLTQSGQAADAKKTGDEISQIKEDLIAINNKIYFENLIDTDDIVTGSYVISNNGGFRNDSSMVAARTGYIDIADCEKIVYSRRTVLVQTSSVGVAFYDSNKTYISGISDVPGQSERSYIIHETPTPSNAKYVVMTLWSNNLQNAYLYDAKNYDSINIIEKYVGEKKSYHAENLKSLPILNSFSDITIDTASYSNCEAFHNTMNAICTASNGYITRQLLGDDGHGNSIYKYETHPKRLRYAVDRGNYAPTYPVEGGKWVEPFTVLLTANIHGRERNGNWVIYNLLNKLLAPDSEMLRFFHDRVKLVCVPYICATGNYSNSDGVNINRDFPVSYDGTCTSNEATFVKSVIDEYGKQLMLHLDIHTFSAGSTEDHNTAGWIFTDSGELAKRCVITAEYVLGKYAAKYPSITRLSEDYIGSTNIETTCTYYTQAVYGVPSATVEAVLTMDGSPAGADAHTSATAYFYDVITQTICSMI